MHFVVESGIPDLSPKNLKNLFHSTFACLKSGPEAAWNVIFQGFWPDFRLLNQGG
jgi:hypothetical protein